MQVFCLSVVSFNLGVHVWVSGYKAINLVRLKQEIKIIFINSISTSKETRRIALKRQVMPCDGKLVILFFLRIK